MKDWEELYILQQLRQEQRKREMMARNVTTQRQEQQRRARIAENRIIGHLEHSGAMMSTQRRTVRPSMPG